MEHELDYALDEVKNLSTVIADRLAGLIEAGTLKPGQHLVQTELAEQFGVSRVAARDALYLLRERGLAVNVPRKGTIVRPISCKTVRDLFAVRRAVEGMAVCEACARMTDEILADLERAIREQEALSASADPRQAVEKDWEFHEIIFDLCDNEPLKEVIVGLWTRTRQARSLAQGEVAWGRVWSKRSTARHRRILDALRERNAEKAEKMVVETITMAEEELVQGLREAGWGEDNGEGLEA